MDMQQMTTEQIKHFLLTTKPQPGEVQSMTRQKQRTEAIYELAKRQAATVTR